MSAELLPCPFCNGAASITKNSGNEVYNQSWHVGCAKCKVGFTEAGSNSWAVGKEFRKLDTAAEAAAITAWNRRPPASSERVALSDEQLRRVCASITGSVAMGWLSDEEADELKEILAPRPDAPTDQINLPVHGTEHKEVKNG